MHFSPPYQGKWCRVVKFSEDNVRMETGKIHKVIYSTAETRDNKVCLRKFLLYDNSWNKRVQIIFLIHRCKKVRTNWLLTVLYTKTCVFLILIRNKKKHDYFRINSNLVLRKRRKLQMAYSSLMIQRLADKDLPYFSTLR